MDVFLPAQNVPESLIANLTPYLTRITFVQGPFKHLQPLWWCWLRPGYKWLLREREWKKRPCRRALINYGSRLSCCVAGTRLRDRWRLPEQAEPGGRDSSQREWTLYMSGVRTGNRSWRGRGSRLGALSCELEGVEGKELWMNMGNHMGFLSWIPGPGDNVVRSIIKKHHVLSKFSAWCWTWWWRGSFMKLTH